MVTDTQRSSAGDERTTGRGPEQTSIGQLVSQLTEQVKKLVMAEIELAKAEATARAQQAGVGIGLFAAAAFVGFFAVATLIATAILGLANAVPAWLAALIVTLVLLALTVALALVGRNQLQSGSSKPERTIENVKSDVAAVKEGLNG